MPIGDTLPSEHKTTTDPETGREITQYTNTRANSYPLYYFIPSHTSDGQSLIFHTDVLDGFSQICAIDVKDLVDLNEYWDCR